MILAGGFGRNVLLAGVAFAFIACTPAAPTTDTKAAPAPTAAEKPVGTPAPAVPAPATPGVVTVAPGASIEAAASGQLGAVIAGEIKLKDQTDWYKFDNALPKRDLATVRLQNKSATLKPDFKIYDANRSQVAEFYDGTPGSSKEATLTLEPGKTIYVQVLAYGSSGAYELSVTPKSAFDGFEPNDDVLTASSAMLGQPLEGSIMDKDDADWFRFTGASSKSINIVLDNMSSTLKPDVKVYSATKSQLTEKYDGTPGANLDFKADIEPGKDFYVQVLPYGSTGKYKLTVK